MSETMTSKAKPEIRLEFFCVSDIGRKTRDRLSLSANRAGIGVFVQNDLEITSVDISLSDARIMAEKLLEYINALGEKK
jgi:hypothetical protein